MLGYSTHFAQLAIINLVASSSSSSKNKNNLQQKRMGYLGLLILVGEISDLLLLVTNSLKQDLQTCPNSSNTNKVIVGLALTAVGTLATPDMARNLAPDIRKHVMGSGWSSSCSPYIRKKALLAMARCIYQAPDTVEYFFVAPYSNNTNSPDNNIILSLLSDTDYGVLLAALQMIRSMLRGNPQYDEKKHYQSLKSIFASIVPTLVKILRKSSLLITSIGNHPCGREDYVAIPLVQVQILSVLRLLLCDDDTTDTESLELVQQLLNDLLRISADYGTYAVLYECIVTILGLQRCEDKLQQLAITTILSHFLQNKDPNIVYVGLETLSTSTFVSSSSEEEMVVIRDLLQQHRHTILQCIKDPDISIRRRALDLLHRMVDTTCIDLIAFELLSTLSMRWSSSEHRGEICTHLLSLINRYPNYDDDCWKLDVLLSILSVAGRECNEEMQWSMIGHISRAPRNLQCYTVHRLMKLLLHNHEDYSNHGLRNVAVWCIGEYSDLLLNSYSYNSPSSKGNIAKVFLYEPDVTISVTFLGLEPYTILHTVETIISNPMACPERLHQIAITSLAKMYHRWKETNTSDFERVRERICHLLDRYGTSHSLELQSRSCEFVSWIRYDSRLPPFTTEINPIQFLHGKQPLQRMSIIPRYNDTLSDGHSPLDGNHSVKESADLLDLNFDEPMITSSADWCSSPVATANPKTEIVLDSNAIIESHTKSPLTQSTKKKEKVIPNITEICPNNYLLYKNNLQVINEDARLTHAGIAKNNPTVVVTAFSNQIGLKVYFECSKPSPGKDPKRSDIMTKIENMDVFPVHNLTMQVAVPSFLMIQIFPPSSTSLPATLSCNSGTRQGGNTNDQPLITQKLSVVNTMLGIKQLKLKVKIKYNSNGHLKELLETVASFPEGY